MYYDIVSNHPDCNGVAVIRVDEDGSTVLGCHPDYAAAEAQMDQLYDRTTPERDQFAAADLPALVASAGPGEIASPRLAIGGASPGEMAHSRLNTLLATNPQVSWVAIRAFTSPTTWGAVREFVEKALGVPAFHCTGKSLFVSTEEVAVVVEVRWGDEWTVTLASADEALHAKWFDAFAALLAPYPPPPPPTPLPDNFVPVSFWMQDVRTHEAYARRRNIEIHRWDEVAANYPAEVGGQLGSLMSIGQPSGGKIVLFHGPPGTGKTRAILTLISEWRNWCHASVVTDADKFFDDATYLNSIVFNSEGMKDWLLLVIEDGDDYLNVSGRESKGQSIARLLNIGDGIIGQGLNLLTLITTNVPMDELNPAIRREGRCMADLHFGMFEPDEGNAWLADRGVADAGLSEPASLAKLYRALAGAEDADGEDA